jgi:hypothetical protein
MSPNGRRPRLAGTGQRSLLPPRYRLLLSPRERQPPRFRSAHRPRRFRGLRGSSRNGCSRRTNRLSLTLTTGRSFPTRRALQSRSRTTLLSQYRSSLHPGQRVTPDRSASSSMTRRRRPPPSGSAAKDAAPMRGQSPLPRDPHPLPRGPSRLRGDPSPPWPGPSSPLQRCPSSRDHGASQRPRRWAWTIRAPSCRRCFQK